MARGGESSARIANEEDHVGARDPYPWEMPKGVGIAAQ